MPIHLTRRTFLTASAAVAVTAASGIAQPPAPDSLAAPKGLLEATFGPLAGSLLSLGAWSPMPTLGDRASWAAVPPELQTVLLERAEKANTTPWPMLLAIDELDFVRNGNRTRFEALTFGRRARLGDLVLGECVEAKGRFLDQIANGVWLICEESFWGVPAHLGAQKSGAGLADVNEPIVELFGAETAATLAWVVYLLATQLNGVSKQLVPRVQQEARRRILQPYLQRDDFSWMGTNGKPHHVNNWNPWIGSNVLTAALLLDTDATGRAALVAKVCRSVDAFLGDYSGDGGCEEGPNYWGRSAASFFDVCVTLVSAHGGKGTSVLQHPFLRAMGHYIADVHIAKSLYVNYGDAHVEAAPEPEEVYRFGKATGDDLLRDFGIFEALRRGTGTSGQPLRQAMKTDGGGPASLSRELRSVLVAAEIRSAGSGKDALVRDSWYPKLQLMTARENPGQTAGFFVALQAASNGRSHGHNDSGSFMVFYDGEPVFIDVGVEAYTAKTFSKNRYGIWTMQSAFHNLPTIGGIMQQNGNQFQAGNVAYRRSDARTTVSVNLATAYPKESGIVRWTRALSLNRNPDRSPAGSIATAAGNVSLTEDFELAGPKAIDLNFMTAKEPIVSTGSVMVGAVRLSFDPAALTPTVEKIPLTDAALKWSWGDAIWRLKLSGTAATGLWRMEMVAAR